MSSAGATIGVIISGTIFLQFMSSKFVELGGRYRDLTREYRSEGVGEARHARLQSQIRIDCKRLHYINWASWLAAVALMCVLAAGLFFGLVLIGCAVGLELFESVLSRHELGEEVGDLDDEGRLFL